MLPVLGPVPDPLLDKISFLLSLSQMPKLDAGSVMEELASTVLEITGGKHQSIKWPGKCFWLTIPAGAVPEETTISLAVRIFLAEGFQLP